MKGLNCHLSTEPVTFCWYLEFGSSNSLPVAQEYGGAGAGERRLAPAKPLSAKAYVEGIILNIQTILNCNTLDAMALRELSSSFLRITTRSNRVALPIARQSCCRYASTVASGPLTSTEAASAFDATDTDFADLEAMSSFTTPLNVSPEQLQAYDPVKRAKNRRIQLPASR